MILYFLVAISPLIFSYFFPKLNSDPKSKKRFLVLCGIVLVLFIGLRSQFVGSEDSINYYNHMRRALLVDSWNMYYNPNGIEKGFQVFVYILSRIFNSPQMLFVATAVIYSVSILYCIYKNSDNVTLSTVMYITLGLMQFEIQGMRQAIAMSICILAYEFAKKHKILPFAILVLLAALFHRTAIVFAITYFITMLPYNWIILIGLGLGSGILLVYSAPLMELANDIFETNYAQTIDSGGFVATAIYIIIIAMGMMFYRKELYNKNNKNQATIMYLTIISFTCYIMRYFGAGISERISFYFMFAQCLLLPNTIKNISKDYKQFVSIAAYAICILLFLYRLRGSSFVPYRFFWN